MTRDELDQKKTSTKAGEAGAARDAAMGKVQKRKKQQPIIMISPSSTALITMHNVKRFLEDAV